MPGAGRKKNPPKPSSKNSRKHDDGLDPTAIIAGSRKRKQTARVLATAGEPEVDDIEIGADNIQESSVIDGKDAEFVCSEVDEDADLKTMTELMRAVEADEEEVEAKGKAVGCRKVKKKAPVVLENIVFERTCCTLDSINYFTFYDNVVQR